MDEENNKYSIGVYGNQVAAASCPSFGATMLQTLARKITDESELSIEFNNKPLPTNPGLFPNTRPGVAEVFGVSVFTITVLLMTK